MFVAKFCYGRRAAILDSLLRFPRSVLAEVKYLLTGRVSKSSTKDGHLPTYTVSFPMEPTLAKPDDLSIREASVSVPFPKLSLQLTESAIYSPCQSPPEGSQEPEEVIAGPSNSPAHPEHGLQDDHAPSDV